MSGVWKIEPRRRLVAALLKHIASTMVELFMRKSEANLWHLAFWPNFLVCHLQNTLNLVQCMQMIPCMSGNWAVTAIFRLHLYKANVMIMVPISHVYISGNGLFIPGLYFLIVLWYWPVAEMYPHLIQYSTVHQTFMLLSQFVANSSRCFFHIFIF